MVYRVVFGKRPIWGGLPNYETTFGDITVTGVPRSLGKKFDPKAAKRAKFRTQ